MLVVAVVAVLSRVSVFVSLLLSVPVHAAAHA